MGTDMTGARRNENGSVAIVVALSSLVLFLIAGAAIDYGRLFYAKSALQQSLDAAALAAGREEIDTTARVATTEAKLKRVAQAMLDANIGLSDRLVTPKPLQLTYTPPVGTTPDSLRLTLAAKIPTSFLSLVGIDEFDLTLSSRAQPPQPGPIDLALVLDTTKSMDDSPGTGGESKITTLKAAATTLASQVMASGSRNIQVGVVPYAGYVNTGKITPTPSWILPVDIYRSGCSKSVVEEPPSGCSSTTSPCTVLVDGVLKNTTCTTRSCTNPGVSRCLETQRTLYTWTGCVGARTVLFVDPNSHHVGNKSTDEYLATISNPTNPAYSGQTVWPCGTLLLPLTSDRDAVLNRIAELKPNGETHIPTGLTWGWNILAPPEPYVARTNAELQAIGGKKVLLLMTDGINSLSPRPMDGALVQNGDGTLPIKWRDGTETDRLTSQLCTNIKNDGILIYTVLFDVPAGSAIEGILRNCASDPKTMSFSASDKNGLLKAFREIGDQLKQLKLTQ